MNLKQVLRNRVCGCYLGVAIGDALGMPVETMLPYEIRKHFPQGITDFEDAVQTRIPEQSDFIAGQTTDDWQLTRVVNQSIVSCRDFDIIDIATFHCKAFRESQAGWGRSTIHGVESLLNGRSPLDPAPNLGPKTGGSNGVAMKVAPLGCYMALRNQGDVDSAELWNWVCQLANLTHTDSQAWDSAFVVSYLICRVMTKPYKTHEDARSLLLEACEELAKFTSNSEPRSVLARLEWSADYFQDPQWITESITPGWQAKESVVYAILVALSFGTRFSKALLYAVNDGIDSDSTASIAGAIMGANGGTRHIPRKWKVFSPDILMAEYEAKSLCDSVLK